MEVERLNLISRLFCQKRFFVCLTFFLFCIAAVAQSDEGFESTEPVLISEASSTKAIAISPENWANPLPTETSEIFPPGSRVTIFVTNIALMQGEEANAFRVFAEDANGKRYRLIVEDIQRRTKRNPIYGLTLRIVDANGYNGQPPSSEVLIWVSWRGNTSNRVRLRLGKTDKGIQDAPGSVPTPATAKFPSTLARQSTGGDRKRFAEQAAFGPNAALDFRIRQIGIRRWIDEQFYVTYPTIPYPNFPQKSFDGDVGCGPYGTSPEIDLCHRNHYWAYNNQNWMFKEAFYGNDQLRRRTSWALSQIWVVSVATVNQQRWLQEYIEILDRNAFGNYRDLMSEMTRSPAMGEYLDMVRSTRTDPNENYPREIQDGYRAMRFRNVHFLF